MKKTLLDNENHLVEIERDRNGEHYIHWQVHNWDRKVLGECLEIAAAVETLAEQAGLSTLHAAIDTTDGRLLKFYKMVKPYDEINDVPGYPNHKVVSWYIGE